ncbi:MAG: 16S rRNA (cytosine(967)-C(5))-methyltransferase [Halioglobus sp.]|nr:16S rRNA (cytosine(967)-C(5))-methyltransferase [Halioglobus sp.]
MSRDVRAAAAAVVGEVLGGRSLNQALPPQLAKVAQRDRALLQQLCYGSLRAAPRLAALLAQLLDRPLRERDRDLQGLLLVGLYQIDGTRVPDHAAVSATVAATAALKKQWARGMVNAVLRRYLREGETLAAQLEPAEAQAHPAWLYRALQAQWPQDAADMLRANNAQPPMVLRVNRLRLSRQDYLQRLQREGIDATPGALAADAIYLAAATDVEALPGFAQGDVSVQDEAAQLAAPLLAPRPGERVLDACAAPGGKACHLLELQPRLGELVAMDNDAQRLARVRDNLARLGLAARVLQGDAASPPADLAQASFDRILVDAPCSASGVIRRHPDIKLLRRDSDSAGFAAQQQAILRGLWPLLRPGGALLYATCSVLAQENDAVVQAFLDATPDAAAVALREKWGRPAGAGRQLLPAQDGPDGLFYAVVQRRAA